MKKVRRGFTLVEVALFLAITAAIFVGIAVGTQNSIFQQRYNDAVQNFAEFLRSVYSQVTNVQSEGSGRSEKAIYGKLVVFGEDGNGENEITTYNVIGDVGEVGGGDVLQRLITLNANIIVENASGYQAVGFVENYQPRWASQIQTTKGWDEDPAGRYNIFTGLLLVVRHPSSGTVYTYVARDDTIRVQDKINEAGSDIGNANMIINGASERLAECGEDEACRESINNEVSAATIAKDTAITNIGGMLKEYLEDGSFQPSEVDFCVNPNGADRSNLRRDVRIVAGARNASGIEIISDSENWVTDGGEEVNIGDRCE